MTSHLHWLLGQRKEFSQFLNVLLVLLIQVIKEQRNVLMEKSKCQESNLSHVWMRGGRTTKGEEVTPLTDISGHHNLCFQRIWKHGTGLLRGASIGK
ncbi:MAG TPA: hypothetical protein [Caudoviricetes sp.]|nr:MAG TPA: hypothetical protein [Caudoviricetes sp.]